MTSQKTVTEMVREMRELGGKREMELKELDINQWQELLTEFNSGIRKKFETPAVMRIEGTRFAPARHCGGMTFNGERYTYFEPRAPLQPANPDGTPYVAWLMVRMDFLRWATKEVKGWGEEDAR